MRAAGCLSGTVGLSQGHFDKVDEGGRRCFAFTAHTGLLSRGFEPATGRGRITRPGMRFRWEHTNVVPLSVEL